MVACKQNTQQQARWASACNENLFGNY
jgi:hypothetical protein